MITTKNCCFSIVYAPESQLVILNFSFHNYLSNSFAYSQVDVPSQLCCNTVRLFSLPFLYHHFVENRFSQAFYVNKSRRNSNILQVFPPFAQMFMEFSIQTIIYITFLLYLILASTSEPFHFIASMFKIFLILFGHVENHINIFFFCLPCPKCFPHSKISTQTKSIYDIKKFTSVVYELIVY